MKDRYTIEELGPDLIEKMAEFYHEHSGGKFKVGIEQAKSNVEAIIEGNNIDFYPFWMVKMISESSNCLVVALEKWAENGKKGFIMYDNNHAEFFKIRPIGLKMYGFEHLSSSFQEHLDDRHLALLSDYLETVSDYL